MKITVCKDCKYRYVGCHAVCKEYIEEKKKLEEQRKLIQNANLGRHELFKHRVKMIEKANRHKR